MPDCHQVGTFFFSCLETWAHNGAAGSPGCQALALRLGLYHHPSWGSCLPTGDHGQLNCMGQFHIYLSISHWFCFYGEPRLIQNPRFPKIYSEVGMMKDPMGKERSNQVLFVISQHSKEPGIPYDSQKGHLCTTYITNILLIS